MFISIFHRKFLANSLALATLFLLGGRALPQEKAAPQNPPATTAPETAAPQEDIQVQARGPLHEAYARPHEKNPQPTPVVPKKPPEPLPEEPPDQKPAGKNVQWIPGYWSWDTEKKDYVWVSGFWRVPPPDRKWVPGHWTKADNGWQWVPGLWADAAQKTLEYLPEPPASVESGPTIPAPNDDSFYVPGCWVNRNSGYVWRPGFWSPAYENWVWNPATYRWTPSGYVYDDGYWDYPLAERGLLFAPVYFNRPLWLTPGWSYQPSVVVRGGGLFSSLFVGPYCHYYFGDYYSPSYLGLGYYPWYAWGRRYHDPLFSYYHWRNFHNPAWLSGLHQTYWARRNGDWPRPAHTFAQQRALLNSPSGHHIPHTVTTLNQFQSNRVHLTNVAPSQLADHRATAQRLREASVQRNRLEKPNAALSQNSRVPPSVSTIRSVTPNTVHAEMNREINRQSFYAGPAGTGSVRPSNQAAAPRPQPQVVPRTFAAPVAQPRSAPSYSRPAPSFSRPAPSYSRPAPSLSRSAPSFRGGSSGAHFSGGGGRSGGGGGHRR
jgi:hypothetical protein